MGHHGDGVQQSRCEQVKGAVHGFPGEVPLSHSGDASATVAHATEKQGEAAPLTGRLLPLDAQTGLVSVANGELLHSVRSYTG